MRASPTELLIVLAIVIVIFGPKQLPRLGKMLGQSLKSFKKGMEDDESTKSADEVKDDEED
ncbi:MAG: twin-arginine translocase TatA/TatE family subunit [Oscillospiraceae bacterium]|nr:twin-arginine translocase TatA/TatE family subunit [Oscillospiraceae bacterium]